MKRTLCVLLVCLMFFTLLPTHAVAAERTPIGTGYADIDYFAEQILAEIPLSGKTDREKIQAVYEWIIRNCRRSGTADQYYLDESVYDNGVIDNFRLQADADLNAGRLVFREELEEYAGIQSDWFFLSYDSNDYVNTFAYQMMEYRIGNCAHYAALLTVLLGRLGYDCRLIDGAFLNSNGSAVEHKWNYVLLDGTYYWLDPRMDHANYERTGKMNHQYFMVESTDEWAKHHDWDHTYSDWLSANSYRIMADYYGIQETTQPTLRPENPWDNCSAWAYDTMEAAWYAGLIPASLENADLTRGITRAEFAAVAVRLYESLTGMSAPDAASPFYDTSDPDVAAAYALGVVNGMGEGRYAPNATLTREQAVTMLGRVCELVDFGTVTDGAGLAWGFEQVPDSFRDGGSISAYARNYVAYFAGTGVVNGMGDGSFAPTGTMTREQALKVALETVRLG